MLEAGEGSFLNSAGDVLIHRAGAASMFSSDPASAPIFRPGDQSSAGVKALGMASGWQRSCWYVT